MRSLLQKLKQSRRKSRNTEANNPQQHTHPSSNDSIKNSPRAENSSSVVPARTQASLHIVETLPGDTIVENGQQSPSEEETPNPPVSGFRSNIIEYTDVGIPPIADSDHSILDMSLSRANAQSAECMWDAAYDDLKIENEEVVRCFERIISGKMEMLAGNRVGTSSLGMSQKIISQSDPHARRQQMRKFNEMNIGRLQDVGPTRTWHSSSLEGIMHSAWQKSPQSTLAWTGLYCACEV